VPGSFARTLGIMRAVRELGLPLQIGTTVTLQTVYDLPALALLLQEYDVDVWNVFFLVPTGRGQATDMLDAAQTELVLQWLWKLSKRVRFRVRTTAAQHYRRVVVQQERLARGLTADLPTDEIRWEATGAGYAFREGRAPQQQGVNDGKGFAFVSHVGDVYPSGFLPIVAGNVRETSLVDLYREHPLFLMLRDPDLLQGKCGRCPFRAVCGGSRARAWALTGDALASDPTCIYAPGEGEPPLPELDRAFGGDSPLVAAEPGAAVGA
jgi:radical SAM protein with 4Fe4S-binding SPASM domain